MRKIIIWTLLIVLPANVFSQENKKTIKSIKIIEKTVRWGKIQIDTTVYQFKNGKPLTKTYRNRISRNYKYNDKGLISEVYYITFDSIKFSTVYEYNNEGYITKVNYLTNDKTTEERYIEYNFTDENNYTVTARYKNLIARPGVKSLNIWTFEMKNNILTVKTEIVSNKTKHKSENNYVFENGNMIHSYSGRKRKAKKRGITYKYDDKTSINVLLKKNILGDKYFINSFVYTEPNPFEHNHITSKNNLVSAKFNRESKNIAPTTTFTAEIQYDKDNFVKKITKTTLDGSVKKEIFVEYE